MIRKLQEQHKGDLRLTVHPSLSVAPFMQKLNPLAAIRPFGDATCNSLSAAFIESDGADKPR